MNTEERASAEHQQLEIAVFDWLCRKYVQRADDRQKGLGLQYTEAETHDLAEEIARNVALWADAQCARDQARSATTEGRGPKDAEPGDAQRHAPKNDCAPNKDHETSTKEPTP